MTRLACFAAALLSALAFSPVLAQTVNFGGLAHGPLGSATLSRNGETLSVSGLSSSGLDGVNVNLGSLEFWRCTFDRFDALALPQGSSATFKLDGSVAGSAQELVRLILVDTGTQASATAKFPFLSDATRTVDVYSGGARVLHATAVSATFATFNPGVFTARFERDGRIAGRVNIRMDLAGPTVITVTGQPPVTGDSFSVAPTTQSTAVDVFESIDITTTGLAGFVLSDEVIGKFGIAHRTGGETTFVAEGNCPACSLTIAGTKAAGPAGTSIMPGEEQSSVERFALRFDQSDQTAAEGAAAIFEARGSVSAVPDSLLATVSLKDNGPDVEISADFSAVGAIKKTARAYLGTMLVDEVILQTSLLSATLVGMDRVELPQTLVFDRSMYGTTDLAWSVQFPTGVTVALAGSRNITADRILIIGLSPTASVDGFTAIIIPAETDIPEMILLEEDIDPPCPGDLNGDGVVDLQDLAVLLANYGSVDATREQGDLDGDGDVDLSDLASLLASYGQPCE